MYHEHNYHNIVACYSPLTWSHLTHTHELVSYYSKSGSIHHLFSLAKADTSSDSDEAYAMAIQRATNTPESDKTDVNLTHHCTIHDLPFKLLHRYSKLPTSMFVEPQMRGLTTGTWSTLQRMPYKPHSPLTASFVNACLPSSSHNITMNFSFDSTTSMGDIHSLLKGDWYDMYYRCTIPATQCSQAPSTFLPHANVPSLGYVVKRYPDRWDLFRNTHKVMYELFLAG